MDVQRTLEKEMDRFVLPEAITNPDNQKKRAYFLLKRGMDVILSFTLLLLLAPLFIVIAVLIKLDSPGPVIFKQERVGSDWQGQVRRLFNFYKFRSMHHNCDQSLHREHIKAWTRGQIHAPEGSDSAMKLDADPRITRLGRFLRKTSLDELPQLWNVLEGAMSLVGPRPVPPYEVAEYDEWHYQRLNAPAGITGLWQVKGRGQVGLDEMVLQDIEYIDNQSIWLDIHILLLTIPVVLARRGAS